VPCKLRKIVLVIEIIAAIAIGSCIGIIIGLTLSILIHRFFWPVAFY